MKRLAAAACAAMAIVAAEPASAAIHVIDFKVELRWEPWVQQTGTEIPFGAGNSMPLYGQALLDDTQLGTPLTIHSGAGYGVYDNYKIVGLTFTAGNQTWTETDLHPSAFAAMSGGTPFWLNFTFGPTRANSFSWTPYGGGVSLTEGENYAFCRDCTWYTQSVDGFALSVGGPNDMAPAPEPATWAMLILGFGVSGMALRRSRSRRGYAALS